MKHFYRIVMVLGLLVVFGSNLLHAQDGKNWLQVYGFVMTDIGYNANQIHPDWFDVVRPTKLPTVKDQYGTDGNAYFSVRQTRFGTKSTVETVLGELFTQFEWELFGTGVDAGQTTIRLRHAYGELGQFGVGQYWSPFMDIDVFPNTVEYWGPTGMAFFRNIQFRWMPIKGDTRLTFALERPGASADQGDYAGHVELQDVKPNFPAPDFSAEYRFGRPWGYVELAGIVRYMKWEDLSPTPETDISGDAVGWGVNLSSNIKFLKSDVLRLSVVYGEGIENYMNDAPVDVAIKDSIGTTTNPEGVPVPLLGVVAFLEHSWSDKFSTAIGYSFIDIDNTDGQSFDAFSKGDYAIGNLVYTPVQDVMMAAEVQWGKRENFKDSPTPNDNYLKTADIVKVQFSFKYNFSHKMFF